MDSQVAFAKLAMDVTPSNCDRPTCPQPLLVQTWVPDHNPLAHGWTLYYSMN